MYEVKITAVKQAVHQDLIERYENPLEHACDVKVGACFISRDAKKPDGFCNSAWEVLFPFVQALANGKGNFFDGWMKDEYSAMVSCNDGFRPLSFYLERITK